MAIIRTNKIALALCISAALLLCAHPASAQAHADHQPHWSYSGADGPAHWGDLSPDFAACKTGRRQSSLNIVAAQKADLAPIDFEYQLSPLKIINNGHAIQVNYAPGSSISINGIALPLVQFHFHHLSETEINGKKYDMELHLVHIDAASGRAAVVAILIKSGNENPLIGQLWNYIPTEVGKQVEHKKMVFNAADFLPADKNYYVFDGSLTTPPCSEGIKWYVLKTPIEASPAQIARFARLYPDNARPVQPQNGRKVEESQFTK
ncbi:MAG: carbonic anhydrase family protein [Candidatus Acidiferrales bacterium]